MKFIPYRNLKRFLYIFTFILLVFFSLLYVAFSIERNNYIDKMKLSLNGDIHAYSTTFTDELTGIASDVNVIKEIILENDVLQTDGTQTTFISPSAKSIVENSFLVIAQSMSYFDQIRIIDSSGYELSRVNYNNGSPYIVSTASLQDKSDRYYVTNSLALPNNSIYISNLDLNIENGQLEIVNGEYKPMLRFSTPLYNDTDELLGILVVNYLVNDILKNIDSLKQNEASQVEILNEDGYYIHADNQDIEFGFMFNDGQNETVDKYNEFDVLENTENTIQQFIYKRIIYTTLSMDPQLFATSISNLIEEDINFVSESGSFILFSQLQYTGQPQFTQKINLYIILASFSIVITYMIARLFDELDYTKKERMRSLKYLAEHDYLTNLPNRAHIMTVINAYIEKQKKFSIMFIDLDCLKGINDTYGHLTGDNALVESAHRIVDNIRSIDIVARVGGDEFIVLFDNLVDKKPVEQIAKRILTAFSKPFKFDTTTTTIGLSIGIATHQNGQSIDDLITAADQAMYHVKTTTKNNYQFHKK